MRRISVLLAVALVSLLAAVAVAGLPSDVPDDVVIAERPAPTTTTTVSRRLPTTTSPTTSPSTSPETSPATEVTDGFDATTIIPRETARTEPPTTPPPTEPPPTTAVVTPDALRVVVVNATNQPGLGADNAAILTAFGYTNTVATDALDKDALTSAIYFADGFQEEAGAMAPFVQLDPASVTPLPEQQITVQPVDGDVWLVVGGDRVP